jgi:NAD(P)-dependent dehydrogenase (short-subunit alcohol dehydrogenase family)
MMGDIASTPTPGVMIVTGGGRGIGAATVRAAAAAGYAIGVNFRSSAGSAKALVNAIVRSGGRAVAVQGDTASEADVVRLFETVDRELGPVRALVNNAGTTGRAGRVADLATATLREVLDVNVVGCFLCAREAIRRMSTHKGGAGGCIVNVSSRAAVLGGAGEWVHYAASKGAIDTLTVGLAREVGAEGIRVNAVRPGLIDTEIHATAGTPDRLVNLLKQVPAGRIGTPEEVAATILWLCSPQAAYVSGALVDISGAR